MGVTPTLPVKSCGITCRSTNSRYSNVVDEIAEDEFSGPVELPPQESEEFTPAEIFSSITITGGLIFLLYRSFTRRAKRAKEVKFRSSGDKKSISSSKSYITIPQPATLPEAPEKTPEQAPEQAPERQPPTILNTLGGSFIAGVIAFIFYNFSSGVHDNFSSQVLSSNYQIRQISITVRTIVEGISWMATFVFAANGAGLFLYAIQLALNPPSNSDNEQEEAATETEESEGKSK